LRPRDPGEADLYRRARARLSAGQPDFPLLAWRGFLEWLASQSVADAWRDRRRDGGCVIDIQRNEILAGGLSMPHSPRLYGETLYLLDSGSGAFGHFDPETGAFHELTFCPGYARGLAFAGDYAVVGLSLPRHEPTFQGLALQERLEEKGVEPRCGLLVIELSTGDVVEWVRLEEPVRELYDVLTLPGVRRPKAYGFKSDEIRTHVWADPEGARPGDGPSGGRPEEGTAGSE
jgi:uncharacterized protein (TIGR03032 family)